LIARIAANSVFAVRFARPNAFDMKLSQKIEQGNGNKMQNGHYERTPV